MDVAAAAPTEITAPPPRPAAVKADGDERSFDDHLDVAAAEEDDLATAETPPAAGSAAPPAPPSPQPVALTLGFQLIASEAEPATAAEAAPAVTPAPPQNPTPAQQQGSAAPTAPLAASAPAAKVEHQTESAKSEDASAKAAPILPHAAEPPAPAADIAVSAAPLLATAPAPPPLLITPPLAAAAQITPPVSPKSAGAAAPVADVKAALGDAKSSTPRAAAAAKTPFEFAVLAAAGEEQAQVARADVSAATLAAPAPQAAQNQSVALETTAVRAVPAAVQVGREIVRRFSGGNTRFEMRLDPPELGRIEVRLDVSRDHRVTAVISADNPQALTDLVRHARELEQALQSAGLELSDSGLSFDLRQSKDQSGEADGDRGGGAGTNASNEDTLPTAALAARPLGLERWSGLRVDIMA